MMLPTLETCMLTLAARDAFDLAGDYSNDTSVNEQAWPEGMKELANTRNRIGGFFEKVEDTFFFAGSATEFNAFLIDYSTIRDIERHRLVLRPGKGQASSLKGGNRRPCDWMIRGRPGTATVPDNNSHHRAGSGSKYVLEVEFWTGGTIATRSLVIPQIITVDRRGR